ncbi:PREDICTED: high affinity immunoglobulin epsilon receptor subunit alpha [Condylura cristata]|uniref:high affinity immunoglobulin epsilon receptor subunit alpha n=1 Tax=Condylura cristata TaxID=143302 RepID=UPI000643257F|nr:PREDICTED: high affinity immunoglobulin epsilon receptor subunit alpha [Condylura cristata]
MCQCVAFAQEGSEEVCFRTLDFSSPVGTWDPEKMLPVMRASVLLWTAVMLFSISLQPHLSEATWKSVVSLYPPWNRIFKGENVTFTCYGNNTLPKGSNSWIFNNTSLNVTTSSLDIVNANDLNSGEYRCQNENFNQSDPVYLRIFSDWLLLQATAEEVIEGESLFIRCHSWKNQQVKKVTYYKDGIALKYWYENHNISINSTTMENSGVYFCMGSIWHQQYNSSSLRITVKKKTSPNTHQSNWLQLLVPLLVVILFAVDTVLFTLTQQDLKFLLMMKSTRKGNRSTNRHKTDLKKN